MPWDEFAPPNEEQRPDLPDPFLELSEEGPDQVRVRVKGSLVLRNLSTALTELGRILKRHSAKRIIMDFQEVAGIDDAGAALCAELKCSPRANVELVNLPEGVKIPGGELECEGLLEPRPDPNLLVQIGENTERLKTTTKEIITFIGETTLGLWRDFRNPAMIRWDNFGKITERAGSDAVPIAVALSFLMGAVLAFQSAVQLRKFGANIFVADLVAVSICLEMGPLMTAIIVSGRSGAAYAAHIGTMQVREEIDALRVMGIDPIRFLVSPRVIAVGIVLPCLTILADAVGILGGCFVAGIALDVTPAAYFNQVQRVLEVSDILKGLLKAFVFGIEIATIGCLRGFQVRGGADSVGHAATSGVVTCIFVLTITDALFAVMYHYSPFVLKV
jgi:phospholipid/cholesterol/gamma-HCH transport system permease protein